VLTLLCLKLPKCAFCKKVLYLGHKVSKEGVSTDPVKVDKVVHWPTPTSTQKVQQFLGLASYNHKFIQNFALIARHLQHLTKHGRTFTWTMECATSFAILKKQLTKAPILVFPDSSQLFILDTDASQEVNGVGQFPLPSRLVPAWSQLTVHLWYLHLAYFPAQLKLLCELVVVKLQEPGWYKQHY